MQDHLHRYEKYIQSEDSDILIQSAIVHAQFEILHPFLDGNGRIGRLLIPLFLYYKKVLSRPMFYLTALVEQAKINSAKVKEILSLYFEMRDYIVEHTRSQYAHHLLDAIFYKPVFRSSDVQKRSNIPKQSLMPMLKQLQDEKVLIRLREARGRMPAVLVFPKLLEIAEDNFLTGLTG